MKVCFYNVTTTNKIGGIETYCWEMAKELKTLGYEVEIIAGEGNLIKYPEIPLTLFPFKPRDSFPDLGRRFRKLMERLSLLWNAKDYLKTTFFDVFLVFKPFDFVATKLVKKWHPHCLTVFISGGEDFWWFDRWFVKSIDFFVSVSQSNAQKIKNRYQKKVEVIPNGVNTKLFKPNPEVRKKMRQLLGLENKKVLISVGRIVGWKGYQLVIKALKTLPEDYVYVLIGEGEYLKELKTLANKLNLTNRVIFLGAKKHEELPKFYLIGDVFVQPSIGHEAFGITIIEAMACGLPVVGSKSGGIKELVKNGYNGFLFEVGSVEQLSEKVKKAFENKEKFGINGREFVKTHFSWEVIAKNFTNTILKRGSF